MKKIVRANLIVLLVYMGVELKDTILRLLLKIAVPPYLFGGLQK